MFAYSHRVQCFVFVFWADFFFIVSLLLLWRRRRGRHHQREKKHYEPQLGRILSEMAIVKLKSLVSMLECNLNRFYVD